MVKSIAVIGDSIAHGYGDTHDLGWFARLGKKILLDYPEEYVFSNLSCSGDNIADVTNKVFRDILSRPFDLIIVSVGINDLRRRKDSGLQLDFSEGARKMYWDKLLDALLLTKSQIVVTDLVPVVEERYTKEATLVRLNSDVERYNALIGEICQKRNIRFFSRYAAWKQSDITKLYKDATHPNSDGHQRMADEIFAYLAENNLL